MWLYNTFRKTNVFTVKHEQGSQIFCLKKDGFRFTWITSIHVCISIIVTTKIYFKCHFRNITYIGLMSTSLTVAKKILTLVKRVEYIYLYSLVEYISEKKKTSILFPTLNSKHWTPFLYFHDYCFLQFKNKIFIIKLKYRLISWYWFFSNLYIFVVSIYI